jgi:hypothetical protein
LCLLFYFVVFPVSQNDFKVVLFPVVVAVTLLLRLLERQRILSISGFMSNIYLVCGTTTVSFLLLGLTRGNEGVGHMAITTFLSPLCYILLFGDGRNGGSMFRNLEKVFLLGNLAIFLSTLSFVFYYWGYIADPWYIDTDIEEGGNALVGHGDVMRMRYYPVASLVFLVPYFISSLLCWYCFGRERKNYWRSFLFLVSAIMGCLVAIIAGRRALLLVILLAPVIAFPLIRKWTDSQSASVNLRKYLLFAFVFLGAIWLILVGLSSSLDQWSLTGFFSAVEQGFDFESGISAIERKNQFFSLLSLWLGSPFIGNGIGCAAEYVRSERAYQYELQYSLMLASFGIIGMAIFVYAGVKVIAKVREIAARSREDCMAITPVFVGAVAFVIANATNPYFQAPGQQWMLFVLFGVINWNILDRSQDEAPDGRLQLRPMV